MSGIQCIFASCTESNSNLTNYIKNNLTTTQYNSIKSSCGADQSNVNKISGITIGEGCDLNITQKNQAKSDCVLMNALKTVSNQNMDSKVSNEMKKELESHGILTTAKSTTDIRNDISNYLTQENISKTETQCMVKQLNDNIVSDITCKGKAVFDQLNESYNNCVLNSLIDTAIKNGASQDIKDKIEEKLKADNSLAGLLFGSMDGSTIMAIVIIIAIVMIIGAYFMYSSTSNITDKVDPNMLLKGVGNMDPNNLNMLINNLSETVM